MISKKVSESGKCGDVVSEFLSSAEAKQELYVFFIEIRGSRGKPRQDMDQVRKKFGLDIEVFAARVPIIHDGHHLDSFLTHFDIK